MGDYKSFGILMLGAFLGLVAGVIMNHVPLGLVLGLLIAVSLMTFNNKTPRQ